MPTPKAKRGVSLVPLGGVLAGTLLALVRGHSLSYGLYLYSWALLGILVMLVPVRRRTAADILEQERNPWTKVSLNPVSTGWLVVSLLACLVGVVLLSPLAR
ncbi:hypothetical protein ACQYWQ_19885 [Streptomyces sp. P6-2-1]|uniref:hypothetical protein n=1 Tax=unclassified Streptomyces TaxID=2593676 RepID=UPI003D35CC3E